MLSCDGSGVVRPEQTTGRRPLGKTLVDDNMLCKGPLSWEIPTATLGQNACFRSHSGISPRLAFLSPPPPSATLGAVHGWRLPKESPHPPLPSMHCGVVDTSADGIGSKCAGPQHAFCGAPCIVCRRCDKCLERFEHSSNLSQQYSVRQMFRKVRRAHFVHFNQCVHPSERPSAFERCQSKYQSVPEPYLRPGGTDPGTYFQASFAKTPKPNFEVFKT